jgi:hypothetical protein
MEKTCVKAGMKKRARIGRRAVQYLELLYYF